MTAQTCIHPELQVIDDLDSASENKVRCIGCATLFNVPDAVCHIQELRDSGKETAWIFLEYASATCYLDEDPEDESSTKVNYVATCRMVVPDLNIDSEHLGMVDAADGTDYLIDEYLSELAGQRKNPPTPSSIASLKLRIPELRDWAWRTVRADVTCSLLPDVD